MKNRTMYSIICLGSGIGFYLLTRINTFVPIAMPASLFLLLAFSTRTRPGRGFALLFSGILLARMALQGLPDGDFMFFLFVLIREGSAALAFTLPFLADRLLTKAISRRFGSETLIPTMVFPVCATVASFLMARFGLFDGVGTLFAYTYHGHQSLTVLMSLFGLWGNVFLTTWMVSMALRLRERKGLVISGGILAALLVYGGISLSPLFRDNHAQTVRTASVVLNHKGRRGAPSMEKILVEPIFTPINPTIERLDQLAFRAVEGGAEIVASQEFLFIVPENQEQELRRRITDIALRYRIHLVVHYVSFPPLLPDVEREYFGDIPDRNDEEEGRSVAILVSDDGELLLEYEKHNISIEETLWFDAGPPDIAVAETRFGSIAVVICRDLSFPSFLRIASQKGAGLVIAPSYETLEAPEVSYLQAYRGVESGFSVLRPTANGLSVAMDSRGRILSEMNQFTTDRELMFADLPVENRRTLYSLVGDFLGWVSVCAIFIFAVISIIIRRKRTDTDIDT